MSSDAGGRAGRSSRLSHRLKHPFQSRAASPPVSTFSPSDILPQDGHQPYPKRPPSDGIHEREEEDEHPVYRADAEAPMSGNGSVSPPSVFDGPEDQQERVTPTTQASDEQEGYDLKAPAPNVSHTNIEELAARYFSTDHLDVILRDHNAGPRFVRFLQEFMPRHSTTLTHYIESRKAITAVEYANAIAEQIPTEEGEQPHVAATLGDAFATKSQRILEDLIEDALPAYLTHRMVALITDCLVKAITGEGAPVMRDMVPNLAEVFCISDPSLPDNPIVYASEEFYNTSQYGRDYAIGRNCRFLQGPKTAASSVRRLVEALSAGQELCETILNYRRDGTPFMNLLMIAPMYDNKGEARYFLGAQIDISPLIEGGKGMDTFAQLLAQDRSDGGYGGEAPKEPMELLAELGQMLNESEAQFVRGAMSGRNTGGSGRSTPSQSRPQARRYLSMDDTKEQSQSRASSSMAKLYPDESLGHSGRLPGVYRNYLLVRPYPSLRVTFTSPTLRIPGMLQTKLLDRIGGPQHLRDGVLEAFQSGTSLTAKVPWLTNSVSEENRTGNENEGKPRWIHCTPLCGSDDKVGVWMVILVENEEVTGLLNRQASTHSHASTQGGVQRSGSTHDQRSYRGGNGRASGFATPQPLQLGAIGRQDTGKGGLYAEYLKSDRPNTSSSTRERREVDEQFRDF